MDKSTIEQIIRYAAKAPSSHNSQPWRFKVRKNVVELHPDFRRTLPVVDPNRRELYISLGAALENFVVAARAHGFDATVDLFPGGDAYIRITLRPMRVAPTEHDRSMLTIMKRRQSNRRPFNMKPIPDGNIARLRNVTPELGTSMEIVDGGSGKDKIISLIQEADRAQMKDPHYKAELLSWLRLNKHEAEAYRDGLWNRAMGTPTLPSGRFGRILTRPFLTPNAQFKRDRAVLETASHFIIFSVDNRSRASWVLAGRYFERVALCATELGLSMSHFNQVFEVPGVVSRLRKYLGLSGVHPVLMVRIGFAAQMPHSLRRPLKDVVTYLD